MSSFIKGLNKAIEYLLITLVAIMVISCVWQVLARFIFSQASAKTEELMRYSIIWVSVIGGAYVYGEKGHLAITVFVDKMKPNVSKIIGIFLNIIVSIFSIVVLVYGGSQIVIQTMVQISPGMRIPIGYVYLVLPISGVLFTIYAIQQIKNLVFEKKN